MPLHLSEIKGNNYFLIEDKDANDTLKNLSLRLETGLETEDFLKEARESLCGCIGYRQAERIGSYGELRKAVQEDIEHRRPINEFSGNFWEAAKEAAREVSKIDVHEEIARDAIYHTLRRTGFVRAYNIINGTDLDEFEITNSILSGDNLYSLSPLPKETVELLTKALISSLERKEFMDSLERKGLSEEQIEQIDGALYKSDSFDKACDEVRKIADVSKEKLYSFFLDRKNFMTSFEELARSIGKEMGTEGMAQLRDVLKKLHSGLGKNQPFRLGRALRELYSGGRHVEHALGSIISMPHIYHLGDFAERCGSLKTVEAEHVHTRIASLSAHIYTDFTTGNQAIPIKLLTALRDLTGLDPYTWVSKFKQQSRGSNLIYPNSDIPDDVLGELYGEMLSKAHASHTHKGKGEVWRYELRKPKKQQLIDLFEKIGKLDSDPGTFTRTRPIEDIDLFRESGKKPYYTRTEMTVPRQIINIYLSTDPEALGDESVKLALRAYLENKGRKNKTYGAYMSIPLDKEGIVRSLADRVGLKLSKGVYKGNRNISYVNNPSIVGF